MKRIAILLILLVIMLPLELNGQSAFSGAYIGKFTTQQRGVDSDTADTQQYMRLYNRILLRYEPSETFAVRTAFRRADYFQENEGNTHIYYGYLDWNPFSSLNVKAGRQYPYNKLIRRAMDGVSAEWQPFSHWTVQGLWGFYTPYDRAGFTENPEDEHGYYYALKYSGLENSSLRGAFYQQVSQGRILNYIGFDGRYPDLFGTSLYGFFKYNISENFIQEAEGQARKEIGDIIAVTGAFKYRDPNFDLPEWYWQFTVDPYSTYRVSLDYYVGTTGSITVEYFNRILSEYSIQRYRLGWLCRNWTLGVVRVSDGNSESQEWNIYGSVQHNFGRKLLTGLGVNYFDYIFNEEYEEPLNAFGGHLFVKYRVLGSLLAGARVYYLTNPEYSNDVRFVGELSYQF